MNYYTKANKTHQVLNHMIGVLMIFHSQNDKQKISKNLKLCEKEKEVKRIVKKDSKFVNSKVRMNMHFSTI